MSLALAPVILTLGAGPSGFSKQLSGRRPKLPRQPWQTRAVARARSVILALGAGPSGFPKQFSGRRPKLLRQPPSRSLPSFWRWGLARRASRNKVPSDAKRGDLGRRQPWQTRAVARARSVISALLETTFRATAEASATAMANPRRRIILALGAGPSGFPKQFSGRRPKLLRQPPSLASVVLALGVGPTGFPKQVSERCKAGGSWTPTAMANPRRRTRALRYFGAGGLARRASGNNLPGEASATAMANPRRRSRMLRYFGAGGWPVGLPETSFRADLGGRRGICGPKPMSQHGRPRFSRAMARPVAAMAVLSTRSGQMARSLASGCGWPISCCPV